jgi:hypothetical protein
METSSRTKVKEALAHIQAHRLSSPVKHTQPHFAGSFSRQIFHKVKRSRPAESKNRLLGHMGELLTSVCCHLLIDVTTPEMLPPTMQWPNVSS